MIISRILGHELPLQCRVEKVLPTWRGPALPSNESLSPQTGESDQSGFELGSADAARQLIEDLAVVCVLEDVLAMFLWIYLSWSGMSCAVYGDNCGLRQKVKLGHLSKCWDSELLPLFCGYFEAAAVLQYVIYLGWWHLGVFKRKTYVYILDTGIQNIIYIHLTSNLLLVWFV